MALQTVPAVKRIQLVAASPAAAEELRAFFAQRDPGVVPRAVFIGNGIDDFTVGDTLSIGGDVYEFIANGGTVANDANIAVEHANDWALTFPRLVAAINGAADEEHANITLADLTTPAVGRGTESVVAVLDGSNIIVSYADAQGGNPTPGSPDILLAEDVTPGGLIWACGDVNMNTLGGRAPSGYGIGMATVTVTAAMITNGLGIEFGFALGGFSVQVHTAAGAVRTVGTDTFAINGSRVDCTFGGGAAPDIQATDVLTVTVHP